MAVKRQLVYSSAFSWAFVSVLLPVGVVGRVLAMTPLLLCALWHRATSRVTILSNGPSANPVTLGLTLSLTLLALAFLRGWMSAAMQIGEMADYYVIWGSVAAFLSPWVFERRADGNPRQLVAWSMIGLAALVGVNITLWLTGIMPAEGIVFSGGVEAKVLSLFGWNLERASFPLASGVNGLAAASGGGAVACAVAFVHWRTAKVARAAMLVMFIACVFIAMAVDSRTTIALVPICAAGGIFLPARLLKRSKYIALVLPLLPVVLTLAAAPLADLGIDVARSADDLASAGKRVYVWEAVSDTFARFSPVHIIGYGYFGQTTSGAVYRYGPIVGIGTGFDLDRLTAHNGLLQYMLDSGYVGALVFLFLTWSILERASSALSSDQGTHRVTIAVITYLLLMGMTQAIPTAYERESMLLFLGFATAVACSPVVTEARGRGSLSSKLGPTERRAA